MTLYEMLSAPSANFAEEASVGQLPLKLLLQDRLRRDDRLGRGYFFERLLILIRYRRMGVADSLMPSNAAD